MLFWDFTISFSLYLSGNSCYRHYYFRLDLTGGGSCKFIINTSSDRLVSVCTNFMRSSGFGKVNNVVFYWPVYLICLLLQFENFQK